MEAAVSKLTLDDVKAFHHSHYGPEKMVMVLIGNFKKADAEALVRKHFEAIPARPLQPDPTFVISHSTKATWDVPARTTYFLAPGPFDPKERLVLTMFGAFLAQLLQNSPDVYQNVQAIYSSNQSYPVGRLPFFIFMQAQEESTTEKAVPALFARLDQAVQALDDDKRVELIKTGMTSFITSSGLKSDEPDFPMMHYQVIGQEALSVCIKHMLLDGRSPNEFAAEVQSITPEEFRAVVKKRLDRSKLLTVSFDPRSETPRGRRSQLETTRAVAGIQPPHVLSFHKRMYSYKCAGAPLDIIRLPDSLSVSFGTERRFASVRHNAGLPTTNRSAVGSGI
jgi:hypothetical protein